MFTITPQIRVFFRLLVLVSLWFFFSHHAYAVPEFLERWRAVYPESDSDRINCQLCHQKVDGGDGWNGYGNDVRLTFIDFGRSSIEEAFLHVEQFSSDEDVLGLSNIEEINLSLFPGWVNTTTNTIYFKSQFGLFDQAPPFFEGVDEQNQAEVLCFPIKAKNTNIVQICL